MWMVFPTINISRQDHYYYTHLIYLINEEKVNKYIDRTVEIKELWKKKNVKVVPVVIGALNTILKRLGDYLININARDRVGRTSKKSLVGIRDQQ